MKKFDAFLDRLVKAAFDIGRLAGVLMIVAAVVALVTVFFIAVFASWVW